MSWKRRSSSSSGSHNKSYNGTVEPDEEDEDTNDEWLELGLGPCNSRPSPPSQPTQILPTRPVPHLGLELGLGFGRDDGDDGYVRRRDAGLCLAPPAHFRHGHHHHHMVVGQHPQHGSCSTSLPSSSLSSLPSSPWDMDVAGLFNREEVPQSFGRRPGTGVWFTLRTANSRDMGGEALPQIPKAYIRVKDENVTIFMVKTYLVRKLGLTTESEIDISCMGRKLSQSLTLKQVRDAVWLPGVVELLNGMSPVEGEHVTLDRLMSLCYERHHFFN